MSITVADCLKLPSLKEAKVQGGHTGLNKTVSYITVLEHVDFKLLEDSRYYLGDTMVISGFSTIKDNVEEQCKMLQILHDMGEACFVLYYVGNLVPKVDKKLIALSERLGFPLIVMPPNRLEFRYSDTIYEVMSLIFNDQRQQTESIVSNILEKIAHLKPNARNVGTTMRLLSDRLMCSLLLTDRSGRIRSFAPWPFGSQWDENDLKMVVDRHKVDAFIGEPTVRIFNDREAYIHSKAFDTDKQKGVRLIFIDETGNINDAHKDQAVEALQLFANIWKSDFEGESYDALVRAILNNQSIEMRRIARQLCVNVEALDTMWVVWRKNDKSAIEQKNGNKEWMAAKLMKLLKENGCISLVDVFQNYVVAFLDSTQYLSLEVYFDELFSGESESLKSEWVLFEFSRLRNTEDVTIAFAQAVENMEAACKIFPHQLVLTQHELRFVKKCCDILDEGETEAMKTLQVLEPLLSEESEKETIETLETLLLDCNGSVVETSEKLYVHKSTIKYRIKKAKTILGFDVTKTPANIDLYGALAIRRLLK